MTARQLAAVLAVTLAACVAVLILLTGCGGGDRPDDDVDSGAIATKPVAPNCERPGVCT